MSITAFPVLARILKALVGFSHAAGQFCDSRAAMGDVTAWCILAIVVAISGATDLESTLMTLALVAVYGLIMLGFCARFFGGSLLLHFEKKSSRDKAFLLSSWRSCLAFLLCHRGDRDSRSFRRFRRGHHSSCGWRFSAETHLATGAFLFRLAPSSFFAFIGLRTQIGLLSDPGDWWICGAIIVVSDNRKLWRARRFSRE